MNKRFDRIEFVKAANGEDTGKVLAKFGTSGVKDLDGDVIEKGAIGVQQVQISAFGHTSWQGSLPVGKGVTREDGDAQLADLQFFMDTTHGRDHFLTVKALGDLGEWSYGFDILRSREPSDDERQLGIRQVIQEMKVFEVSPVLRGAGIDTGTVSAKCDGCGVTLSDREAPNRRRTLSTIEWAAARRTFAAAATRLEATSLHRPTFVTEKLAEFAIAIAHQLTGCPFGLAPPALEWFLPDGRRRGFMRRGEHKTFLALDYGDADLVTTILHEALHHQQVAEYRPVLEPEAEAFAAKWARPVLAAFMWADGETHRVAVREGEPPSFGDIPKGHVVLARGGLFNFNRSNTGPSWNCVAH